MRYQKANYYDDIKIGDWFVCENQSNGYHCDHGPFATRHNAELYAHRLDFENGVHGIHSTCDVLEA